MSKSIISFLVFIILVVIIFISISFFKAGKSDLRPTDISPVVTPASTSAAVTATTSAVVSITKAEVQKHNSELSCWTVIRDGVYDLTSFISKHPGGAKAVSSLCGINGTSFFVAQHDNQKGPNNELAGLRIGDFAK